MFKYCIMLCCFIPTILFCSESPEKYTQVAPPSYEQATAESSAQSQALSKLTPYGQKVYAFVQKQKKKLDEAEDLDSIEASARFYTNIVRDVPFTINNVSRKLRELNLLEDAVHRQICFKWGDQGGYGVTLTRYYRDTPYYKVPNNIREVMKIMNPSQ